MRRQHQSTNNKICAYKLSSEKEKSSVGVKEGAQGLQVRLS